MTAVLSVESCRSCGQPVIWAVTERGKNMPVDAEPSPSGNVVLTEWKGTIRAGVLGKAQASAARSGGRQLYLSHFVVCRDAKTWRKR